MDRVREGEEAEVDVTLEASGTAADPLQHDLPHQDVHRGVQGLVAGGKADPE